MDEIQFSEALSISWESLDGVLQPTIDARKLHAVLKVGRVFAAWIAGRIEEYKFNENKDFVVFSEMGKTPIGDHPLREYRLSLDMGKGLAMVENNEEGRKVWRYFIECERKLRCLPDFNNPAIAARAWAEQYEQRQIVEQQRDEAIRTKTEIGIRRKATAINTASVLSKENDKIHVKIGDSKYYKQVRAIPWLPDVFTTDNKRSMYSVVGRKLSEISRRMKYEIKEVEDAKYGMVNAYHVDVIDKLFDMLQNDKNMLRKYRWFWVLN